MTTNDNDTLISIKASWRWTSPAKLDTHLVFVHAHGGEVWVARDGTAAGQPIQAAWRRTGQPVVSLVGNIKYPDFRQLSQAEWDEFRQTWDLREAYSINGAWRPIREFDQAV